MLGLIIACSLLNIILIIMNLLVLVSNNITTLKAIYGHWTTQVMIIFYIFNGILLYKLWTTFY